MQPPWKVGELARRTGLSVRTLHHYDEAAREVREDRLSLVAAAKKGE